jgi:TPR repeat protein
MAYKIDKNLEAGQKLLVDGKKVDSALKLINKSARKGETKGKSFFEIGEILRKGVSGLEPSIEESKKYYDEAISHFFRETCDSMDNRELGDYFNYGFGSEPANKERALQYYDIAAQEDDDQGTFSKGKGR